MKRMALFSILAISGAVFFAGCGEGTGAGVDENKTPAQIQSEAANMKPEDIQAMVAKYQKAIEAKAADLKKETEKLTAIPLQEQMGDKAKDVRAEIAKITESMNKLKANMEAYIKAQTGKK